ncbi:DNA repair protein RecO [Candidatus Roizmanbacteria bacterium CG2_30_33_16]|uniref:DNA repair protein RecO n=5 Tax=Candidatus Roizmaniibacteriota TaxID=1752723 RepID=A0A2H0C248_9BACT|nr:DNA repair protein RecO [Candidatus Roizmanbacteria bacterium]OIP82337.1 MAG: DNA repair protein RecO [Candidatus Roizmanbacteria bacterium CG2_30_33_16]PIP63985.1 MAG: DNA repair protein RecO [Candidatus Roizmanbacteria bacterium CG22_combo_CG10-13_8_21_14_all_33_16]PIX72351.1 MAG: DNA repair protein RecO [Candidatus Roizmanbacteria bacterium CG_4_10_14_3_um_filter_33_21]PJB87762.1 MAG: DNA repair protein RecO [Candidatus Roizmanbacteria bacterium CG_4_9_14_0_8_um_filter_34_12]
MNRVITTTGIVLRKRQLLRSDLQFTIFTEEIGKINIFAKGIRKITSKRLPNLQTGNLIKIQINQHNNAFYLQTAQLISALSSIKQRSEQIEQLYLLFFILDRLLPEAQRENEVFKEVISFIIKFSKEIRFSNNFLHQALKNIVNILGYPSEANDINGLITEIEQIISEKVPQVSI